MAETKKTLVIINPISGIEKKGHLPEMIQAEFLSSDFDVEIRHTQYANHAFELAKEASDKKYHSVIAVGGDGTINEVAAAICGSSTVLGIIPTGSGNGLARHLHIPLNARKSIELIKERNVISVDYCSANGHPFFCTCGIGFDAKVSEKFAQSGKRGPISYLKSALTEYLRYRSQRYKITTNKGLLTERAFIIACGNASQYGNNAYITPNANVQDGLIDVTVILPITPLDTAMLGILLFSKHIDQDTNIISFQTPSLKIERETSGIVHLDGEPIIMPETIDIECHAKSLNVFVPKEPQDKYNILSTIDSGFWNFVKSIREELNI